jgi:hypothetical protein
VSSKKRVVLDILYDRVSKEMDRVLESGGNKWI